MTKSIYIDSRWKGMGGIGTFYEEINRITKYNDLNLKGNPASPIDFLNLTKRFLTVDGAIFLPGYIPPLFSNKPYIFTIHDLNHVDRPENSSIQKRVFYNSIIKKGCRDASYIFTVSNFSKSRIIDWAGVDERKVINVGNGVSSSFTPEGKSDYFPFQYLLCVSNRKYHKNEHGVIEAFSKANIDNKIKLVFTGVSDQDIIKLVEKFNIKDRVLFTGYLNESELPILYRSAKALVFPSFYEGFGLPVIESQASGVPVITSNGSSLKEISGGASLLVDPTKIDEISNSIELICTDSNLVSRLIDLGLHNVTNYSWNKTATMVDKYLKKIV